MPPLKIAIALMIVSLIVRSTGGYFRTQPAKVLQKLNYLPSLSGLVQEWYGVYPDIVRMEINLPPIN